MEPPKVYKDKPSAQHVIDVVSIQFNSGFGNKLDGHESRIQIKAPVQETANTIHDNADVSKKGENGDITHTKGTVVADKAESNIQDFGEKLEYETRSGRKLLWPLADASSSGSDDIFPTNSNQTGEKVADADKSNSDKSIAQSPENAISEKLTTKGTVKETDKGTALFSKASILSDNAKPDGITESQANAAIEIFKRDFGNIDGVKFIEFAGDGFIQTMQRA